MLPGNVLSTTPVPARFSGARSLPITKTVDYEDGGIAFNDPSQGLLYQRWRARIVGDDVVFDAPTVAPVVVFTQPGITEISISFDQNMRPVIAFVSGGRGYLRWYDTAVGDQVVTPLAEDVITPRVTLDDKRAMQSGISDIILGYKRGNMLYYRQQRDRFLIERDPTADMPEPERTETRAQIARSNGVIKIGMSRQLRLNFMLEFLS